MQTQSGAVINCSNMICFCTGRCSDKNITWISLSAHKVHPISRLLWWAPVFVVKVWDKIKRVITALFIFLEKKTLGDTRWTTKNFRVANTTKECCYEYKGPGLRQWYGPDVRVCHVSFKSRVSSLFSWEGTFTWNIRLSVYYRHIITGPLPLALCETGMRPTVHMLWRHRDYNVVGPIMSWCDTRLFRYRSLSRRWDQFK